MYKHKDFNYNHISVNVILFHVLVGFKWTNNLKKKKKTQSKIKGIIGKKFLERLLEKNINFFI